jgi:hypothetical protein
MNSKKRVAVFTVGHSTRTLIEFVGLLQSADVKLIAETTSGIVAITQAQGSGSS